MRRILKSSMVLVTILVYLSSPTSGLSEAVKKSIYDPGKLKPIDSVLKVRVGELAPDFVLPSVSGEKIALHQFHGKKNIVISFVPAAWTPVCSEQ